MGCCYLFPLVFTLSLKLYINDNGAGGVQITALRVPAEVRNGSREVILDCEYTLRPEELSTHSGLVVKWFFNNGPTPVYQWIPSQKPQDLGILRGRLKLDYRASQHVATMHRALYILNPTTELSGDYKCTVSTFDDEDFMVKKMVVFATEKRLEVEHSKPELESVNISCRAQGVYPEPKLNLYKHSTSDTAFRSIYIIRDRTRHLSCLNDQDYVIRELGYCMSNIIWNTEDVGCKVKVPQARGQVFTPSRINNNVAVEGVTVGAEARAGVYDISANVLLQDEDLETPTVFHCELRIPDTSYAKRKSLTYYPGNTASLSSSGVSQGTGKAGRCSVSVIALTVILLTS